MTTKRTDSPVTSKVPAAHDSKTLRDQLHVLKLYYCREHFEPLARQAAESTWPHVDYFSRLIEGEAAGREDRSIQRRIRRARFPVIKTLEQFQWNWPTKINRAQIQNLFRLAFIEEHINPIFLGSVGVGKSHLSIALAHTAT